MLWLLLQMQLTRNDRETCVTFTLPRLFTAATHPVISKLKSPEILEDALTLESGRGLSYPYRSTKKKRPSV